MTKRRTIILGVACLILAGWAGIAKGQYGIGLYRNGQLIAGFPLNLPALSTATNTSPLAAMVAPHLSDDAQSRNQILTESSSLTIQIQGVLRQIKSSGANSDAVARQQLIQQLASLFRQLVAKQVDVRATFSGVAAELSSSNAPVEIRQRHLDMVDRYEMGLTTLTRLLNDVLLGKDDAVDKALEFLNQIKIHQGPDLTHHSPTRQPLAIQSAPRLTRAQAAALRQSKPSAGSNAILQSGIGVGVANTLPASANDLVQTPDVQFTPAITAEAASLGNNALAIYEFVRNNVAYQPYIGSRKGADYTLQQLAGSDADQASLLIALLRVSGIPCRYVTGTVEMTPAQAMSWLGVDDPGTAGNILTTIGLGGVNIVNGTNVTAVQCTRIWVEAYLLYSNYRGVTNDQTGATWIPLDPALKMTTISEGQDVLTAMGYNNSAFLANYITTYNSNSPIAVLTNNVQNYLTTNHPGATLAAIDRTVATQPLSLGLLPASLPETMLSASAGFDSLSATNRYQIQFQLYNGGTTFVNLTTNLCQLAGHAVTISYIGATSNDQATINSYGGIYQTPPYLVNVKPEILIDGVPVAVSSNSIGMGNTHNSDMYFIPPVGDQNQVPEISNTIIAGTDQAIGYDTFRDVPDLLPASTNGASGGSLLTSLLVSTAADYLSRVDRGEEQADELLRTVHTDDVSEGIVESTVVVTYSLGGEPQTFTWGGMDLNAQRRITGPFGASGSTSNNFPFMTLSGYDGSYMENEVFETTYGQPAVSTMRILQWAADQGYPACYISNSISSACPSFNHSSSVMSAVNAALAEGHIVIIPQQDITVDEWSGTGYIDLNPSTGAAGYLISGGLNSTETEAGGATIKSWSEPLSCPLTACTVNNPPNGQAYCADNTPLTINSTLTITCPSGTSTQPWNIDTGFTTGSLADQYGGGDYTITISANGTVTCTCTFTILELMSQTVATVPANRARSTIGVGEEVNVSLNGTTASSVTWSVSGGGTLSSMSGASTTFTAPYSAGASTVSATVNGTTCSTNFTVLAPSGVQFIQLGTKHTQGILDAGFHAQCVISPTSVSFYNIEISELNATATATGCFSCKNGAIHPSWTQQGAGWLTPAQNNYLPAIVDYSYQAACPPYTGPGPGSFSWTIPWNYRKIGSSGNGANFANLTSSASATVNTCTKSKNGMSVTFNINDPSVNW